jgi:dTDP-4-dehydrorhamnose reductase
MNILITGGSGLLGEYLNKHLSVSDNILTIYNSYTGNCGKYNSIKADITDSQILSGIFSSFKPEIVIHTAAVSSQQKASGLTAKLVYMVNVNVSKKLAELCSQFNARLIYTSTDLVYAGYRGSMLNEDARLIPVSLYAETKLMGEQKIKETFNNYIILRTALLFGFSLNERRNHFHDMFTKLKHGERVKLFTDQYRTPLSFDEAARIIKELCYNDIQGEIINFGGAERLSRYELGSLLCRTAGMDNSLLEKISMNDLPELPHVADVSMDTTKLRSFGIEQKTTEECMKEIVSAVF